MQNRQSLSGAAITGIVIAIILACCLLITTCGLAAGAGWYVLQESAARPFVPGPGNGSGAEGTRVGDEALDFSLDDLEGNTVNLSDYRGQAVLLNFWATSCGYCIDEFPMIQAYQDLYGGQLVVLAVEQGSAVSDVEDFVSTNPYSFIFLPDRNYVVGDAYGVMAIPATFFIDLQGIIQKVYVGLMEQDVIEDGLQAIGLE